MKEFYRTYGQLAQYLDTEESEVLKAAKDLDTKLSLVAGVPLLSCKEQRRIIDVIRKGEIKPADAVTVEDLASIVCLSPLRIYEYARDVGIFQHSKWGEKSWYYPWEAKLVKDRIDQVYNSKKAKQIKQQPTKVDKPKNPKARKPEYWKLSVNLNGYYYQVKACCLTVDEALSIRDTLITCGFDTRISKHIEPKFNMRYFSGCY